MYIITQCEYFGNKFEIESITKHTEGELGKIRNIHNLSQSELIQRKVDFIDIVKDAIPTKKYKKEEDPTLFKSSIKNIGPLKAEWYKTTKPVMCAYKLVRVKFDKWLIGSKVENGIHDHGFREIFLEVNRQCVCWMDQWICMSMDDIRKYEAECAKKQSAGVNEARVINPSRNDHQYEQVEEKKE